MDKLFQPQLLCDLCADLKERGKEADELAKPSRVVRVLLRVLHELNVLSLSVLSYHLAVTKTVGFCVGACIEECVSVYVLYNVMYMYVLILLVIIIYRIAGNFRGRKPS